MRSKRAAEPREGAGEGARDGATPRPPEEEPRVATPGDVPSSSSSSSSSSSAPPGEASSAPGSASSPPTAPARSSSTNPPGAARKRSSGKPPDAKSPDLSKKRGSAGPRSSSSRPDEPSKRASAAPAKKSSATASTSSRPSARARSAASTHDAPLERDGAPTLDAASPPAPAHSRGRVEASPGPTARTSDVALARAARAPDAAPIHRESNMPGGVMPYEPSAPCAACARGVDPLRAACISVTEHSVHYFCSRSCQDDYLRAEAEHEQRLVAGAAHEPTSGPPTLARAAAFRSRAEEPRAATFRSRAEEPRASTLRAHEPAARAATARLEARASVVSPPRRATLEPVARRVAPAKPSTPLWPLIGSTLAALASFAPVAGAAQVGAFGLLGLAIVFASRTPHTRRDGGPLAWLLGPLAVGLLGLAALLGPGSFVGGRYTLLAACFGIALLWLREHLLERAIAARNALSAELSARLSTRVQVSLPADPGTAEPSAQARSRPQSGPRIVERALDSLREGDELLCEAGTVIPVDGIVTEGVAEVLAYPRARTPLERCHGAAVLAGALVVSGTLRVRASRVGARRALFAALGETAEPTPHDSWALALADRACSLRGALLACACLLSMALLSPQPAAAKLAGAAAALLALPALALARGLRNVFRAAVEGAAARGVRFRSAAILERAGRADTAVLRVEGVLVPRVYTLVQVVSLSETHDASALLAFALAAGSADEPSESGTPERDVEPHGITRAVREHARQLGVEPAVLRRIVRAHGLGVSGLTDGQGPLVFGSRAALLAAGVSVAVADREAQRAESSGQKVVFLALGGRVRGLLLFAQTVRGEARAAVQTLFDLGLELTLVSGDHRATVESIARTLDITQVKAELSAEQRAAEVSRLRDGEAHVIALGKAPSDEAMLTSAELSLCLDAAGQPHHHEAGQAVTYDITTATDDLRDAVAALVLARGARRALWRVLAAAAVGLAAGLLGAAGLLPPLVMVPIAAAIDLACLHGGHDFAGRRRGASAAADDAAA